MPDYVQYFPENKYNSNLIVFDCGMQQCPPGYSYGPSVRSYYLIHYITKGSGTYIVNDTRYKLTAGDVFIIKPNEETLYFADSEDPWRYYWVGFNGSDTAMLLNNSSFGDKYVIKYDSNDLLEKHLNDMYFAAQNACSRDCAVIGYLYLVFSCLINQTSKQNEVKSRFLTEKVVDFINANYNKDISIQKISDEFWINRSYLYKVFKLNLNISPMEYLMQVRLTAACNLLKTTDIPICKVASEVGFKDIIHFTKMFKKKCKKTPGMFRHHSRL